jgi:Pyruvate/2-oxoacid:ferredoxin oxidoreductase delta subunit
LNTNLLPIIKQYRAKFNTQKRSQSVPRNTCPIINDVVEFILERDKKPGRVRIVRRLDEVRTANHRLRELGIEWYELCRDLLDELELTVKMKEKEPKDKFQRSCSLSGCERKISDRNKSTVCTHCWNNRPDETLTVWERVRTGKFKLPCEGCGKCLDCLRIERGQVA